MGLLIGYIGILLALAFLDRRKISGFNDFVRAGKKASTFTVGASLLASVVGASATLGVASEAFRIGFPAFWWLGCGAVGFVLCGIFLAGPLARRDVYSLPETMEEFYGPGIRKLTAVIIVIGWTGIVGAQYTACAKMVTLLTGIDFVPALLGSGIIIALYCTIGGQLSVLRTDVLQFLLIIVSVAVSAAVLYGFSPVRLETDDFYLFNESFGAGSFFYYLLIVGSGYFVGPDVFSRLYTAKDETVIRRSLFFAAAFLVLVGFGITMLGLWMKESMFDPAGREPLLALVRDKLPLPVRIVFLFGLLSAIVSSADTCLITVAAVAENDLLGRRRIGEMRLVTFVLGAGALVPAFLKGEIIPLLLMAYNIFNAGIIPPVAAALLVPNRRPRIPLIAAAVVSGGGLGLISSITGNTAFAVAGMLCSVACCAAAFGFGRRKEI